MSLLTVQIPGTEIELPFPQALTLAKLTEAYPESTWHLNDCGCCVCLHPEGDSTKGWLIGADGEASYLELHEE